MTAPSTVGAVTIWQGASRTIGLTPSAAGTLPSPTIGFDNPDGSAASGLTATLGGAEGPDTASVTISVAPTVPVGTYFASLTTEGVTQWIEVDVQAPPAPVFWEWDLANVGPEVQA